MPGLVRAKSLCQFSGQEATTSGLTSRTGAGLAACACDVPVPPGAGLAGAALRRDGLPYPCPCLPCWGCLWTSLPGPGLVLKAVPKSGLPAGPEEGRRALVPPFACAGVFTGWATGWGKSNQDMPVCWRVLARALTNSKAMCTNPRQRPSCLAGASVPPCLCCSPRPWHWCLCQSPSQPGSHCWPQGR